MLLSDTAIQGMRSNRDLLVKELESAGARFRGNTCRCIFHDDKSPSAGVYVDNILSQGVWRFKCQACGAGGDIFDIRARLNKTTAEDELQREAMRNAPPPPIAPAPAPETFPTLDAIVAKFANTEAVYRYTDPNTGTVDMAVIRWRDGSGKKRFTQASPAPGGEWWMKAPAIRPIYNRKRVNASQFVVVVEGEKCVHALHSVGIVATTSPQGAKSANLADWSPLAGKHVTLWQDNDDAGTEFITTVQRKLQELNPPPIMAKVVHEALELPDHGDVADFIERYKGWQPDEIRAAVQDVLDDARPIGVFGDYSHEMEAIIAGKRKALPFPWKLLTRAGRALMPGTVTCFFGQGGATKTLFLSEAIVEWTQAGIRACVFHLEDDRNYHVRRAHAQLASNSHLCDNDWVEANAPEVRDSNTHYRDMLEEIGRCIWDAPDEDVSHEMLVGWVEERAKAGFDIIVIDPVTAVQSKGKPWVEDQQFVFRVKSIARRYGTRVILVTHPRKSGQKPAPMGMDDMAGGAAYQRFSHTVLLIEKNDKEEEMSVRTHPNAPPERLIPNRIMRIAKARNGPGAGKRIAYEFDGDTLRFRELGLVEKS